MHQHEWLLSGRSASELQPKYRIRGGTPTRQAGNYDSAMDTSTIADGAVSVVCVYMRVERHFLESSRQFAAVPTRQLLLELRYFIHSEPI